ncbi:substrate-binding domain-containing protein [Streptomyces ortus]|uniref:Substrate-binding domain-containing protein n=1 Tax=Streptomyces ortus TaxID=2867268 RepID=A0ABT3V312_9ACTN|nr:substrate-binding domain-containing protein [Streptomyces ortus]MCX4234153.1 substrate-binding domain-containing protein [Streptomyces ortus]
MRRIIAIVLAVFLIGGVAAAVVAGREDQDSSTATKTVQGVIGSEKAEFFADPDVVKALAARGYTVETETSGSWAMEGLDLKGYDFAFPSSQAPAAELASKYHVRQPLPRPFYSPLVVVAHRTAAEVLADNGLAVLGDKGGGEGGGEEGGDDTGNGTLSMKAYLKAAQGNRTWQQLKGTQDHGELTGTLFISTTDPTSSNSGALYLAAASYVADGGRVADGTAAVDRTAPLMRKLISVQGSQQTSTDAAFRDFVSGVGNPLVLVYESQVAALLAGDQGGGEKGDDDLVVLYPDTTANSDHTVVPLTAEGRALGELLGTDKELRRLAVRHGFRPQGAADEFTAATDAHTTYLNQTLTGVRQVPVPASKVLHEMARRARDQD